MRTRPTYDAQAVDLLLAGDQAGLTALAAKARRRLEDRATCPDCGEDGPHESNGSETLCCAACGCHFEPAL